MPPKSKKKQQSVTQEHRSVSLRIRDRTDELAVNPPPQTTSNEEPYIEFGAKVPKEKIILGEQFTEEDLEEQDVNWRDWRVISARNLWDILHTSVSKTPNKDEFRRVKGFLSKVCAALNPCKDHKWEFIWKTKPAVLDYDAEKQKKMMYHNLMDAIRRHCPKK